MGADNLGEVVLHAVTHVQCAYVKTIVLRTPVSLNG
jgi:hypothetical protein